MASLPGNYIHTFSSSFLGAEPGLTEPVEGIFRSTVDACLKVLKNLAISAKAKEILSSSDEQVSFLSCQGH